MKNIIILENKVYVRQCIVNSINIPGVNVIEASNAKDLFNEVHNVGIRIDLILIGISLGVDDGFKIMEKLRGECSNIPVIILSSDKKRSTIIKGVMSGAADYILMPCTDDVLMEKITKHLNLDTEENIHQKDLTINFRTYLAGELRKAEKGHYSISILMTLLESDNNIGFEEADKIFIELKKLFWETDLFIRFGLKSFVGVFPFSDEEKVLIIDKKIKDFYINSELGKKYVINLENVFVTFPNDGTTVEELIEKLQSKRV
jgi:DNA-binding response OmpR family regulator